jgi:putative SOS response-associated peptidase YedK
LRLSHAHLEIAADDGEHVGAAEIDHSAAKWVAGQYDLFVAEDLNDDIAPHHGRQMAVLRREGRSTWLDMTHPEQDALRSLPGASFRFSRLHQGRAQAEFAI